MSQIIAEIALHDICANPFDDTLRLMYADLIDEAGEWQRAAYIRTRIEWDTLPECGHDWLTLPGGWKCHTCRRKDEIYAASTNGEGFPPWELLLSKWMKIEGVELEDVEMERGFIGGVTLSEKDWLDFGSRIVLASPVTRVTLSGCEPARSIIFPGLFRWYIVSENDADEIDDDLYSLLVGEIVKEGARQYWRTREAALSALSDACVALARSRANLPSLKGTR